MYKVMIATLLAAGLLAAPLPPHSFAAFAQQSSASEKAAKRKKGQAPASSPRVNARRNAQLSGKKRKPPAKLKRGRPGRNSGATATSGSRPPQNNTTKFFQRAVTSTTKSLRASARLKVSATPSFVIPNRGAAGQPHCARYSMTHTGPYDAISDT